VSHRGSQANREHEWRRSQRKLGRDDALAGRPARYADRYYQEGYKRASRTVRA
jgi:hypothetical protein